MSEERAVQQVLARYVRGTDARDGAAVAAVFTEDGRVEVSYNNSGKLEPLGELMGREAIADVRGAASSSGHRLTDILWLAFTTFYKPLRWLDNSSLEDFIVLLLPGMWVI